MGMARQLREEFENSFYQITLKGNLREGIFYYTTDKERFLEKIEGTLFKTIKIFFTNHGACDKDSLCLDKPDWMHLGLFIT